MSAPQACAYPFIGPLSGAMGWLADWTGDTSFDTVGDTVSLVSTNRGNKVAQEFQKKLSAIDYQIQRQELHRQDIRDLVEVTTGRMDVFLLSGTLLLTFCLGWFSQSRIMESELPVWFENLFLISNFNAVGYLLLCVWLAMHASIASHSLGVRLLVNYQRLSIPTEKQLRQIYVPFFTQNKMENLVNVGQRLGYIPEEDDDKEQIEAVDHNENDRHSWPLQMGADDQHFRRFLQAQSKWLAYDAYARVCLTLGMNQMLHALSYYIVGELGKSGCVAGTVFTFFGVKGLSLAVMKLDVSDGTSSKREKYMMTAKAVCCTVLPSFIAAVLLFAPINLSDGYAALWALPCFLLHFSFNHLMKTNIEPVEPEGGGLKLPRMFRAVGYLSIIEFTQRKIAEAIRSNHAYKAVNELAQMGVEMEKLIADETATDRRSESRCNLQRRMREVMQQVREQSDYCSSAVSELQIAQKTMEKFALWQQFPEIQSMIQHLQQQEGAMDEQRRQAVERMYMTFITTGKEAGIPIPEEFVRTHGVGMSTEAASASEFVRSASQEVEEAEEVIHDLTAGVERITGNPTTSFEMEANATRHAHDHETERSTLLSSVTHFTDRFRTPTTTARSLSPKRSPTGSPRLGYNPALGGRSVRISPDVDERLVERTDRHLGLGAEDHIASHRQISQQAEFAIVSEPTKIFSAAKLEFAVPKEATPPDDLPKDLVLSFNRAIGIWWLMAAAVHGYRAYETIRTEQEPTHRERLTSRIRRLESIWPEPASLFQIASLHCDSSQVIVNNRYSTFSSQRHLNGSLGLPKKFANMQIPAVHCDHEGCDALTQASHNKSWLLAPLAHPRGSNRNSVVLPGNHTWRKASVMRTPCSDGTCDAIRIAGWDGSKVIVADFQKKSLEDKWKSHRSFFVRPGLGKCRAPPRDCPSRSTQYTNVRALQLGTGGRTLMVLLEDGFLDGWDLSEGVLRGRWRHNSHVAMCHDGDQLFLARQSSEGPVIDVAPLPSLLEDEQQTEEIQLGCGTLGCRSVFLGRQSL